VDDTMLRDVRLPGHVFRDAVITRGDL